MPERQTNNYVKYAGLGLQLVFVTLALILLGLWLDEKLKLNSVFLVTSIFVAVFSVIYILINKLK